MVLALDFKTLPIFMQYRCIKLGLSNLRIVATDVADV